METVKVDVKIAEESNRVELFIRFVWVAISYIVLAILGAISYICLAIQWLLILVTGKRNMALAGIIKKFWAYACSLMAYMMLLTDERNPLMPEM